VCRRALSVSPCRGCFQGGAPGPMSVRVRAQELVEHVTIRGTQVSTSMVAPSLLHVSVVQAFGMPGRHGHVVCDNYTIYVRYDTKNVDHVHVWAYKNDPTSAQEEWFCALQ
jgi:hypothetical protein